MIERYRDVLIIHEGDVAYAISCDSTGAIGEKENDVLKVDAEMVGRAAIKVALSEILCVGAWPIAISDALSNEMNPTGIKIIDGIKKELIENEIYDVVLTGSTEENFPSTMTGVGVTAIGRAAKEELKVRKAKAGMEVGLIGYPRVGQEVLYCHDVLSLKDYVKIFRCNEIAEAIPVGSKGIRHELDVLKLSSGLEFLKEYKSDLDDEKSGGPSTCCIVVYKEEDRQIVENLVDKPFIRLGRLS
ncbi:AIR synthase related protein [Thermoanaerobacterium butyriciformans]|uniref:Selenophosphate synthetase-related protein n=1 Tax=Thermoanaerobacterium butyriciformans TaxID=1702242 RepID=A0ABS4NE11_9THEO|nr:AIR synthase related protein [Thermoanaerobacterium butyriciformans]MBP2071258.1 selenophosphate synthetase-related protein [Thermoanaerobacterium butyriciformans]